MPETDRAITGRYGERAAAAYLEDIGYVIHGRNLRLGRDEIDILAFDPVDGVLIFAEVKTRSVSDPDFTPELNVHWRKKYCLIRAARRWIAQYNYDAGWRIDLLCVEAGRVVRHMVDLRCD